MGNMTVNQRNQYDRAQRPELSVPSTGTHVRNRRRLIIFNLIALAVLGARAYATVVAIDGWAKGLVLGVIVLTTIGAMIALSPNRRA